MKVGNRHTLIVAYPHFHICILPMTSAVFLRILPLRRSAHPHFTGAQEGDGITHC